MSEFLLARYDEMSPYVPGEQPKDREYVKLNSNESPYMPAQGVSEALGELATAHLGCYADPSCRPLRQAVADALHVVPESVFVGNGSDEVLAFLFLTFFDRTTEVCFPDVTYGFYHDYCQTFGVPYHEVPLLDDWTVDVEALAASPAHVILPNPNAPTGLTLSPEQIARICDAHPERLVIVDEAYVDYDNPSCVPLVEAHRNLVVVQTLSKSRNLAGAHIGFAVAAPDLVDDVRKIKFAFNPFNVSTPTQDIGIAAMRDRTYLEQCVAEVVRVREDTRAELERLGCEVLPSHTNFLMMRHPHLEATTWLAHLRSCGVLVRHYDTSRLRDWLRVSIGTEDEMRQFLAATRDLL